ncbi:MAG: hypothetical protein USCAAHI_01751 [Beijerinckiaceae bacterium]|nr:MAG: hypothetical protein USCAAHI_01751 [Beijerinckiaceae bacterium]
MNLERDAAAFLYERSRTIEVILACGKQRFLFNGEVFQFFNGEVFQFWLNGVGLGQKREIGIVNLRSFGKRNALSSSADVCHSKPSADPDRHRSDTPVLANMSRCAKRERTKVIVVRFELLLELFASRLFVSGEFILKPFLSISGWPRSTPKQH